MSLVGLGFDSKCDFVPPTILLGFPGGSEVKASACNEGDLGSIPGSGRSPGEGNANSLQYPMDGGAWWTTVHEVAKSWTRLSMHTHLLIWISEIKKKKERKKFCVNFSRHEFEGIGPN